MTDCWCNKDTHLPGEYKKHKEQLEYAREVLAKLPRGSRNGGRSHKRRA